MFQTEREGMPALMNWIETPSPTSALAAPAWLKAQRRSVVIRSMTKRRC
ncbi:MAG: hypothetical protein MZV64_70985 [Ignavibacteriales bacterium]|nr:hypothetical protein [Ignavibacteriales bacterium]